MDAHAAIAKEATHDALAPNWSGTFLRTLLSTLLFVGFAAGGELALIRISDTLSLQSLWTLTVFFTLLGLCIAARASLSGLSRLLLGIALAWATAAAVQLFLLQPPASYTGYVISGASFLLALSLGRSDQRPLIELRQFFWGAVIVSLTGVYLIPAGLAGDHRILQMTVAFAAIIIVARLELLPAATPVRLIGLSAIIVGSVIAYLDAARAASLLITLVAVVLLIFGRATSAWLRVALVAIQGTAITVILVVHETHQRWLGGDSALTLGSTSINTNGRIEMWSAALAPVEASSETPTGAPQWIGQLLGQGVGSSSISSMAANGLSAPLNEFVRVYVDFGLLGLMILMSVLMSLIIGGFRLLLLGASTRMQGAVVLLFSAGYFVFSLSESMVAYSWVLVPTGLLVSSLLVRPSRERLTPT